MENFKVYDANRRLLREFSSVVDAANYAKKHLKNNGRGHIVWSTVYHKPLLEVIKRDGEIKTNVVFRECKEVDRPMYGNIAYPNLRAEFGRKWLTVSGMARELNMTRARLSRMLSGETALTFSIAEEIRSRYFPERSLEYLFGEKDRLKT